MASCRPRGQLDPASLDLHWTRLGQCWPDCPRGIRGSGDRSSWWVQQGPGSGIPKGQEHTKCSLTRRPIRLSGPSGFHHGVSVGGSSDRIGPGGTLRQGCHVVWVLRTSGSRLGSSRLTFAEVGDQRRRDSPDTAPPFLFVTSTSRRIVRRPFRDSDARRSCGPIGRASER